MVQIIFSQITWTGFFLGLASAGLSFLFLALVFRPLEMAFPAKEGQKFIRPAWFLDLCFFLGQYLLWSSLVFLALNSGKVYLNGFISESFRNSIATQPFWLQAVEAILLADLLIYWAHRFQHNNKFLWRFHSVHHSAEHLDWLAAHREHPLDSIYTIGVVNLIPFVMGFPLSTLALLTVFRGIWAIYIHSNVRLPIGPIRMLIGAPELHHWHHDKNRHAGNYANLSPLMDILFGTYVCPDHEPEAFGINEPTPDGYVGYMVQPLLPKQLQDRLNESANSAELDEPTKTVS